MNDRLLLGGFTPLPRILRTAVAGRSYPGAGVAALPHIAGFEDLVLTRYYGL
jgi:hypothetical protein